MKQKILLVEDDTEIREIYKLKFTLNDYNIITIEDGALAIKKIKDELPDIVLLDILLPNKDGFEILKEIKDSKEERINSIPVFMLSNLSNEADIEEAKKLGALNYIVKAKNKPKDVVDAVDKFFQSKN
ncbi:MAG: response regulator [Patescibacteria group bacterium]|nr:response regulator [Patescibacteria group bacterium]